VSHRQNSDARPRDRRWFPSSVDHRQPVALFLPDVAPTPGTVGNTQAEAKIMPESESGGSGTDKSSNVLLLAPSFREGEDEACIDCLSASVPSQTRVVFFTCDEPPADRLAVWNEHIGEDPLEYVVLCVSCDDAAIEAVKGDVTRIERIDDPTDLVDIGTTVGGLLSDPTSNAVTRDLCVYSLTALIDHNDTRDVFTFLEVLTSSVDRAGARAHYHMDPTAHDPETVRTLEELFDEAIDVREE